jgi:nucleoside-diphosphate-sugar epimerase
MAHFQNILLIGSSGLVGKAIQAELLAKRGNFSKLGALSSSASAPDPKKAAYWESLSAQGVEITTVDFFDSAALVRAFKGKHQSFSCELNNVLIASIVGWDVVISAVGLPMVKMQLLMIEAAAVAGVKRFLPSEFGFDLTIPSNRGEKVYAMKIAVADKLEEVSDRYPKFTYTLLAIGLWHNSGPSRCD